MTSRSRELAKKLAFRYTNLGKPRYPYALEPIQLATLVNEMERLADVEGSIVEIGVARGMTTRFLVEHVARSGRAESIHAIDTFEGFTAADIEYEVSARGRRRGYISPLNYTYNHFAKWKENFRKYPFVVAHQADCAKFDYRRIEPIKLALLDVDLYKPTKETLPRVFECLTEGGTILVDDVLDATHYDGAYQAYMEFCLERGLPIEIVGSKCGVARKQASAP